MLSLYILCCGAEWILDVWVLAVPCGVFSFFCHSVCPGAVLENDLLIEHVACFLSTHCFTTHPCYPPHSPVSLPRNSRARVCQCYQQASGPGELQSLCRAGCCPWGSQPSFPSGLGQCPLVLAPLS